MLGIRNRQHQRVAAIRFRIITRMRQGKRLVDIQSARQEVVSRKHQRWGRCSIKINAQRAVAGFPRSEPEANDASRAVRVEHHAFFTSVIILLTDILALVVVGEPVGFVRGDSFAVVAARLFAGELRLRPTRDRVVVNHLLDQRPERDLRGGKRWCNQNGYGEREYCNRIVQFRSMGCLLHEKKFNNYHQ